MKPWIISAYSGKMDGILIVLQAKTLEEAYAQLADRMDDYRYIRLDIKSWEDNAQPNDLLILDDADEQDIKESYENESGPRWYWELFGQEMVEGENLGAAICW